MSQSTYNDIFEKGKQAFFEGLSLSDNPLNVKDFRECWEAGYREAEDISFDDHETAQKKWEEFLESDNFEAIIKMNSDKQAFCFVYKLAWEEAKKHYARRNSNISL